MVDFGKCVLCLLRGRATSFLKLLILLQVLVYTHTHKKNPVTFHMKLQANPSHATVSLPMEAGEIRFWLFGLLRLPWKSLRMMLFPFGRCCLLGPASSLSASVPGPGDGGCCWADCCWAGCCHHLAGCRVGCGYCGCCCYCWTCCTPLWPASSSSALSVLFIMVGRTLL